MKHILKKNAVFLKNYIVDIINSIEFSALFLSIMTYIILFPSQMMSVSSEKSNYVPFYPNLISNLSELYIYR